VTHNWTSEAHFGQNQPGLNLFQQNGPQEADTIKNQAGPQEPWKTRMAELFNEP
jgi:hypothetical protein